MVADESIKDYETVALVVQNAGDDFHMTDIVLDEVRDGEVLVEMKYSGICHTDIVLAKGLLPLVEFPAIFGHEGAGIVKSIGKGVSDSSLKVCDAVLLSFNVCGECAQCTNNHPAFCHIHSQVNHNAVRLSDRSTPARLKSNGTSVRSQYFGHSSFAKHSVVNQRCIVKCKYPDAMRYYAAMGCGFQTGAGTVLNVLKPKVSDSVVIFGMGGGGLSALMAAKVLGIDQIVAVDILPNKLELAKTFGATDIMDPSKCDDVVKEIKKLCQKNCGATFAIDCTGVLKVIEQCIECLAPCGTAVTVGVPPADAKISIDPLTFLLENKRYIGVIEGDSVPKEVSCDVLDWMNFDVANAMSQFIPKLVALHQEAKFPVDKLCKVFAAEDFANAVKAMHEGTVIKPVLQW